MMWNVRCSVGVMLMLHRAFFLWQELPLKHPERMRSPMPQAAF